MRQTIALIFSVVLGLVAVFAMRAYIQNQRAEVTKGMDLIEIAVAQRPLAVGTKISSDMFKSRKIPVNFYINDMIKMEELSSYRGKELSRNIGRNKVVLKNDIRRKTVKISHALEVGERLVTVSVNNTSGVAGLIKPRSKVDIFYLSQGGSQVSLLLSRVRVYAVDNRTEAKASRTGRGSSYSSLTLVSTPDEAALLMAAEAGGRLIFSLRNDHDPTVLNNLNPIGAADVVNRAKVLNAARATARQK